jgi:hypothetical protein
VAAEVGWLAPGTALPVTLDEAVRVLGSRP